MRADSLLTMGGVGVWRVPARSAGISLPGGSAGERGLSSAISEPADSQNLHLKLVGAFRSPDCSLLAAVSRIS